MNTRSLRRRAADQISAWLPALIMCFFALASLWLVRSAPRFDIPAGSEEDSSRSDSFMEQFSVRRFDATGAPLSLLTGERGQHYAAGDTMHVTQPRLRATGKSGLLTTARAQRGKSISGGSEIQLFENALVVREAGQDTEGRQQPRLQFKGEHLHLFVDEDRLLSEQPSELMRERDTFTGNRLDYDSKTGIAHLTGKVHGVLRPAAHKK